VRQRRWGGRGPKQEVQFRKVNEGTQGAGAKKGRVRGEPNAFGRQEGRKWLKEPKPEKGELEGLSL